MPLKIRNLSWFKKKKQEKRQKEKRKKQEKKGRKKIRKRGPKGVPPETAQKLIFYKRTVKKNRNEIEAQKNQILSPGERERKRKRKRK